MGDHCTIEWVKALARARNAIPASLNPIRGCSRATDACRNCWAAAVAYRFGKNGTGVWGGLAELDPHGVPRFNGTLRFVPEVLDTLPRLRRPRVFFVCDMSDPFHGAVPDAWRDRLYASFIRSGCQHHLFLLLTKRPAEARRYTTDPETPRRVWRALRSQIDPAGVVAVDEDAAVANMPWPPPNVWMGASVHDQGSVADFVPELLGVKAALRFLSVEPMLGKIRLTGIRVQGGNLCLLRGDAVSDRRYFYGGESRPLVVSLPSFDCYIDASLDAVSRKPAIGWVISGDESGPRARAADEGWHRSLRDQCAAAGVPFFLKQRRVGGRIVSLPALDGRVHAEIPEVRP